MDEKLLDSLSASTSRRSSFASSTKRRDVGPKVVVRFRAVGQAPIMVQNHYKLSSTNRFVAASAFLRKQLKLKEDETLFCYINSAFSPAPDELISNLYKCFQVDNQLIINYCTSVAWG